MHCTRYGKADTGLQTRVVPEYKISAALASTASRSEFDRLADRRAELHSRSESTQTSLTI